MPAPIISLLSLIVGFEDVLHTIPLSVIVFPPSLITFPPTVAVFSVIFKGVSVDIEAIFMSVIPVTIKA